MPADFGPFELLRFLGKGGMGEVFLARRRRDPSDERFVLKRLLPTSEDSAPFIKRLVLEAQVAKHVAHPNLIRLIEYGCVGESHYLTMEYVPGVSFKRVLEAVFAKKQPVPAAVALHIAAGILDGLSAMHTNRDPQGNRRPFIHRDVKPSNVIIRTDGRPVLIDYGIAKDLLGPGITMVGLILGSARYVSPEQALGQPIDPRSDLYGVAVILFEMLAARHPFPPAKSTAELIKMIAERTPIHPSAFELVPPDLVAPLARGLAYDPNERFSSAAEMIEELEIKSFERSLTAGLAGAFSAIKTFVESLGLPMDEAIAQEVLPGAPGSFGADARHAVLIPATPPVPTKPAPRMPPMSMSEAMTAPVKPAAVPEAKEPPDGATDAPTQPVHPAHVISVPPLPPRNFETEEAAAQAHQEQLDKYLAEVRASRSMQVEVPPPPPGPPQAMPVQDAPEPARGLIGKLRRWLR